MTTREGPPAALLYCERTSTWQDNVRADTIENGFMCVSRLPLYCIVSGTAHGNTTCARTLLKSATCTHPGFYRNAKLALRAADKMHVQKVCKRAAATVSKRVLRLIS
jgi:hypothetical protein